MKKVLFTAALLAFSLIYNAQSDVYLNLKKLIRETHPELNTDNKLIAFNVWSVDDAKSREANKSFEKVIQVYQNARLKGGLKGIIVVAINKDELSSSANIAFSKDGIAQSISVKLSDLELIQPGNLNSVFDSNGTEVYKNLDPSEVYSSVNKLVTR
jgi:hypothetical protein